FGGSQRFAKHKDLRRAFFADGTRQKERSAAIRRKSDLHKSFVKRRVFGRYDNVAGECEIRSRTGTDAADRATKGIGVSRISAITSCKAFSGSSIKASMRPSFSHIERISRRSPPEQNARPSPVSTTARALSPIAISMAERRSMQSW